MLQQRCFVSVQSRIKGGIRRMRKTVDGRKSGQLHEMSLLQSFVTSSAVIRNVCDIE
jgi:hypothetical protein